MTSSRLLDIMVRMLLAELNWMPKWEEKNQWQAAGEDTPTLMSRTSWTDFGRQSAATNEQNKKNFFFKIYFAYIFIFFSFLHNHFPRTKRLKAAAAEENKEMSAKRAKIGCPSDEEGAPSPGDESQADLLEIMSILKEEIAELRPELRVERQKRQEKENLQKQTRQPS